MRSPVSVTALTALMLTGGLADARSGHAQTPPQSWDEARYRGDVAGALLTGNRVVLDIAPHRAPVLSVHRDGTMDWTEDGSDPATGTWSMADDGRFCADWQSGPQTVLALETTGGAWCFYLRRTENALLLYDPFGNVRGSVVRIEFGPAG